MKRWSVTAHDLEDLSLLKARDLLERGLAEVRRETLLRSGGSLGEAIDTGLLVDHAREILRDAFAQAGGHYEHPTLMTLTQAGQAALKSIASRETPADVVEHHKTQVHRVLGRLCQDAQA